VGYAVEASEPRPVWLPRQVVDDGRKSYVLFPVNLAVMPAPMVRLVGPNGYELVNARQVGSVMVLDHLFNVAELRLGTGKTAETVRVVRQMPRTIHCPGDASCPVWPGAAVAGVR
jgi:type IV secretory pathway VirB9-like protein